MPTEESLRTYYDTNLHYDSVPLDDIERSMELFDVVDPPTVLDLGCGDGRLARLLESSFITGVDYSSERIKVAKSAHPLHVWIASRLQEWLDADYSTYSLVTMFEVLEHLDHPSEVIKMARRHGPVLASVPINWPDPAHLHVWSTEAQMVADLSPERYVTVGQRWFCWWNQLTD